MARAAAEAVLDAGNTPACRCAAVLVPELCVNGPVELAQGTGKPVLESCGPVQCCGKLTTASCGGETPAVVFLPLGWPMCQGV